MANSELIKEIRLRTGCGIKDCSNALLECSDDIEVAIEWLRKKGLASATKKEGRITAEGLVSILVGDKYGILVEVNSETDFVAKNDKFQDFVRGMTHICLEFADGKGSNGDIDINELKKYVPHGRDSTVMDIIATAIGFIGENILVRRAYIIRPTSFVKSYVHSVVSEGEGKIGVLLAVKSSVDNDDIREVCRTIAMHIAAMKAIAISVKDLPLDLVEKEREIFREQAKLSGKPDNVIDKMVDGRIRKFYEEVVLLNQKFILDNSKSVSEVLADLEKIHSAKIELESFKIFVVGEGIEKASSDFASEVASIVK